MPSNRHDAGKSRVNVRQLQEADPAMRLAIREEKDALLFGCHGGEGLVAVEHGAGHDGGGETMDLFVRRGGRLATESEPFEPFIVASLQAIADCPVEYRAEPLGGAGALNLLAHFQTWRDGVKARDWLSKRTGFSPGASDAPYLFISDPVQQHLIVSGRTLFLGMDFEDLNRVQVDIECYTTEGYEFCHAAREGDRIIAIAVGDASGQVDVLSGADLDEKKLLEAFVALIRDKDPDVIEGHNIFNFDLPYLRERARRHGVKLKLGRDGSVPKWRPSRFSAAERTLAYERCDIFGRHVVDTLFMVHLYDVSHRSLDGFGLKEVAVHFGLADAGRTYIEGSKIAEAYRSDPGRLMDYVRDDVTETCRLSALLSRSSFAQAQMLPYAYQNVCVRGTATKIDALMLREYLRQRHALPMPDRAREFAGGYTDMFVQGLVKNVHHADVRSLYPSLMLQESIGPRTDDLGAFLRLLEILRGFRLRARGEMEKSAAPAERTRYEALQAALKILINSFYGYLGFAQARFSDFGAAEKVTEKGRDLLKWMIEWLRQHDAAPVEIDTDGIYYVPPEPGQGGSVARFRKAFSDALPEGIEVEFDGEYESMYSYRMKNYALLTPNGEVVIKGAALKSRGLEPFQRSFLREMLKLKLQGRDRDIAGLRDDYAAAIQEGRWDIRELAKTERLQDSPSTYAAKVGGSKRARNAAYELALASGREFRAGDQISYYVAGDRKRVAVHESAKLVSEWDPRHRDENIPYYLSKLDALYGKFAGEVAQGELEL